MTEPTKTVRTSFEMPRELSDRLNSHLVHGQKTQVLNMICELIVDAMDEHGPMITYLIVTKKVKLAKAE